MLDAVNRVDLAMCKIRDAGKIKARDRIAVLAALNLAFELPDRSAVPEPAAAAAIPGRPAAADTRSEPQLSALIARLDAALGMDGQLL